MKISDDARSAKLCKIFTTMTFVLGFPRIVSFSCQLTKEGKHSILDTSEEREEADIYLFALVIACFILISVDMMQFTVV